MLAEETRLKMAVTNKQKQLADEVEHLKFQLEEEEDSKQQLQNRLLQLTQQVTGIFHASLQKYLCNYNTSDYLL